MEFKHVNETFEGNNFWDFHGQVDYVDTWFLMRTPVPLLFLTTSYILFVLKLGPKYMEKRQPFKLTNLLLCYNILQVLYSCFLLFIGSRIIWQNGILSKSCLMEAEETSWSITSSTYYYFFAKLTELLDTVFFVLRKKNSQVSFLHVYHHSVMLWTTWITLKYEPTYGTIFLGTLNSFVHVIMYSYYALSAFPDLAKYLWWKRYITMLQLVQFLCVIIQAIAAQLYSGCSPSFTMLVTIYVNSFIFIYLFSNFYLKSYSKKKKNIREQNPPLNGANRITNAKIE